MELKQTNESEEALSSCCLSDPLLRFALAVRAPRSLHPPPGPAALLGWAHRGQWRESAVAGAGGPC